MNSASLQIGEVLNNTYRIQRLLGEGSMGQVFEATHLRLPRRFAIKVLANSLSPTEKAVVRFQLEAQVTSQLGHPNIVEVLDFNYTPEGRPYLVMELLSGESLQARLDREGRLQPEQVEAVLVQAASALQAAHDQGIVHRDLKPQNLYLCPSPDSGERVKVLDFGISKIVGVQGALTTADTIVGTPYFMAPEQALGQREAIDARTDIFAMGVLLFYMLSGKLPFEGDSIPNILYQIVYGPRPSLLAHCPGLSRAVERVIHRAMSRDPQRRFESVRALADEFVCALHQDRTLTSWVVEEEPPPMPPSRPPPLPEAELTRAKPPIAEMADETLRSTPLRRRSHLAPVLVLTVTLLVAAGLVLGVLLGRDTQPRTLPVSLDAGAIDRRDQSGLSGRPDAEQRAPAPLATPLPDAAPDAGSPSQDQGPASIRALPGPGPGSKNVPRSPRPVGQALLTVHTRFQGKTYWAHVEVDAVAVGDSPVHKIPVRSGRHQVRVHRTGFKPLRQTVVLKPGEHRIVTLTLEDEGPSPP